MNMAEWFVKQGKECFSILLPQPCCLIWSAFSNAFEWKDVHPMNCSFLLYSFSLSLCNVWRKSVGPRPFKWNLIRRSTATWGWRVFEGKGIMTLNMCVACHWGKICKHDSPSRSLTLLKLSRSSIFQEWCAQDHSQIEWIHHSIMQLKLQYVTSWASWPNSHRNMWFRSVILIDRKSKKR